MHLAQLNIARLKHPIDDSRIADFVANLERINGLAERSPGFVWRLKDESGNATDIGGFDDPSLIVNLTVWETPGHLEKFVWQTVHQRIYNRKSEWFSPEPEATFVMWWIAESHRPDIAEARERLERLRAHGDTNEAFGWAYLPAVKLWQSRQCA